MTRLILIALLAVGPLGNGARAEADLLTRAEKTQYTKTSLYADVMAFIQKLETLSPRVRVETLCTSAEGREIPLMILADPMPESMDSLQEDGRLVVYVQANIHAGEVEGKEAVQMLARDMALGDQSEYLKDIILLITPIFNADGNEKLGHNRRDNGPELAGVRHNGLMLDLNRDGIKLESAEVRAMVSKILNPWDPAVFVDCHTTNGSYHEEPVTYAWPLNPNGDMNIIEFMRDEMMPAVDAHLEREFNVLSIPYGNYADQHDPEKGWQSSGPQCRYLTNYVGLRNRMAILLENYAYADFKTRVWGNYYFLVSLLSYCQDHQQQIKTLIQQADEQTVKSARQDSFIVEYELYPLDKTIEIKGYEHEFYTDANGWNRVKPTDVKRTYRCPLIYDWQKKRAVDRPFGYLITVNDPWVLENLKQHGIRYQRLSQEATLEVSSFTTETLDSDERLYQGHHINRLIGRNEETRQTFEKGTVFVPASQPLGHLAVYLLEPECDDGLFAWNFFDRYLVTQWRRTYLAVPVYKVMQPVELNLENEGVL